MIARTECDQGVVVTVVFDEPAAAGLLVVNDPHDWEAFRTFAQFPAAGPLGTRDAVYSDTTPFPRPNSSRIISELCFMVHG